MSKRKYDRDGCWIRQQPRGLDSSDELASVRTISFFWRAASTSSSRLLVSSRGSQVLSLTNSDTGEQAERTPRRRDRRSDHYRFIRPREQTNLNVVGGHRENFHNL